MIHEDHPKTGAQRLDEWARHNAGLLQLTSAAAAALILAGFAWRAVVR